ncbi:coniferyl alcohol acyltransferase-like [Euphorbia lathyris]|uniref:coniferyl alcohol acyltransferase-like n=1 Tax=Euphorbia lathyris TaxID=212925 RepID=UPI0033135924
MCSNGDFMVTVKKKEVVAAVLPMQEHWLPLSNLDLLLPPLDVGVFFCYNKPNMSYGSMVSILKKAMAQVLVSYYAFAGEIVANCMGEPELLCNNHGVEFIEAYGDIELQHLNLYNPDQTVQSKLVPSKNKQAALSIQATELKCGGIVVALTFDHRIADAHTTDMFIVSWAETAQSKPLSKLPSFRRSLLNPRRPATSDYLSLDNFYLPISSFKPPPESLPDPADHLISRIYYVKAAELCHLQSIASSNGYKRTKLESFTAFLWQLIAKCYNNKNPQIGKMKHSKIGVVVNGRCRISDNLCNYFGNVLSIPYDSRRIDEICYNELSWAANKVHKMLEEAGTEEHFLGLIDWVEAHRPETAVSKIYTNGRDEGPAVVVSSGQRFPVREVEFGWGKAVFGSYDFPWGGNTGYVMPMGSSKGNGDWVLYMHLFKEQLDYLETQAAHFFKPFVSHYFNQTFIKY